MRFWRYALTALRACYSGFALKEPCVAWLGQEVSSGFTLGQYLRQRQAGSAMLLALRARGTWRVGASLHNNQMVRGLERSGWHYALAALCACYAGVALKEPGVAWLGQEVSSGFALGQYLWQRQAGSATLLALRAHGAWRGRGVYTTIKWSRGWRGRGGKQIEK
jgi:hypothetical protein